jgi:TolB-like protein/DNA-binding SARP family transcriptional activator/Flp pilus assembly protein TadD
MIQLQLLGAIELRRDGVDVRSVLVQAKRLALLAYLRMAPGFVPREKLLGLFWPESDDERARNALRQSLHFLRRSLGDEVVVGRGDQEVGIDASQVDCDAAAVAKAVSAGRLEDALSLYRGDFMTGFFVDDAPDLERWIEDERAKYRLMAVRASWELCERHAARREHASAIAWARRAVAIEPLGEARVRRLMTLLGEAGERAHALEAFDEFKRRLAAEHELSPSPETLRLAEQLRASPTGAVEEPQPGARTEAEPVVDAPARTPYHTAPAKPPATHRRWRALVPMALVGVVIAVAWFARGRQPELAAAQPPSVAVLPFLNLSGDPANVYFSDGVTEEILNVLARVPGLKVAARTSSFAFRDNAVGIDSIARALAVNHVLEGSVRTDSNHVRITAQLIEASSGFHIWSDTYDRELNDIFTVQDEIAAAIAKQLQIELSGNFWGVSARETKEPEAYRLLLRALHTFRTPSPENYAQSATLLEEAIHRDANYARAYGALANVLLWQAAFGWTAQDSAYTRAERLARRGLEIGATPEAHLALARLAEMQAWAPDSADAHFLRALALNPADARTLQQRALFLARSQRGDEAIAAGRRATELDPLHPGSWSNFAAVLSMLGREEEALTQMERARAVAPNDIIVLTNLANQYSNVGRNEDAIATAERALQINPNDSNLRGLYVHLLFQSGRTEEAKARRNELERDQNFSRFRLAVLYTNTQEIDKVLDLLEEAARRRDPELVRIKAPDLFEGMRHHPRFLKLLDQLESR